MVSFFTKRSEDGYHRNRRSSTIILRPVFYGNRPQAIDGENDGRSRSRPIFIDDMGATGDSIPEAYCREDSRQRRKREGSPMRLNEYERRGMERSRRSSYVPEGTTGRGDARRPRGREDYEAAQAPLDLRRGPEKEYYGAAQGLLDLGRRTRREDEEARKRQKESEMIDREIRERERQVQKERQKRTDEVEKYQYRRGIDGKEWDMFQDEYRRRAQDGYKMKASTYTRNQQHVARSQVADFRREHRFAWRDRARADAEERNRSRNAYGPPDAEYDESMRRANRDTERYFAERYVDGGYGGSSGFDEPREDRRGRRFTPPPKPVQDRTPSPPRWLYR